MTAGEGDLDLELRRRNPLRAWLRADRGVTLAASGAIAEWRTPIGVSAEGLVFTAAAGAAGSAKVKQKALNGRPVTIFPATNCALICAGAQLAAPATVFLLVAPRQVANGPTAAGQRIFGHYPSGQMRLQDGHASFVADTSARAEDGAALIPAKRWTLLGYRFSAEGGAEVSVDGEPFAPLRDSGGAPLGATFSANGQLTLGGVDGTCGFSGAIAEVLLFDAALVASDAATVARYLAQRWKLPRLAPGAASAALAGGAAATAAGGGGGEAAARGAGGSGKTIIIVKADDTKMLDWMPPPGVGSTSAIESWKKQTANAKNKIASFPEGGAPLRACVVLCFCNY